MIDNIARQFKEDTGLNIVIHMDPIVIDDENVNRLREVTKKIVTDISPELSIHDFRAVLGPSHSNLIFDIVIPFDMQDKDEEILTAVDKKVKEYDDSLFTVITVDRI